MHATIDGEPLSRAELLGISHLMLIGGLDTVTATFDCMVAHLAQHPERRSRLVADPSGWPAAIEELLRFETPVVVVPRIIARDVTMGGVSSGPATT